MLQKNRMMALLRKEVRQMLRDKSTLTLGILLPMTLLIIFGYGLSLDVRQVAVALVRNSSSAQLNDLYMHLKLSAYFEPVMVDAFPIAESMLLDGSTQAIVRLAREEKTGEQLQIIVNGRDSNTARIMVRYLEAAISQWLRRSSLPRPGEGSFVEAEVRVWFNDALESRYFLVPGVTVLIMTLIGSLLTALVVAREWERGTWEALIATPVTAGEILVSKTLPYFALGIVGLLLCLGASAVIFAVPMRGSLVFIFLSSSIYLTASLGMGLLISVVFKSQFLASQVVLVVSFMPTIMLSGFIFDLKSAPLLAQYIAHIFPATWYVELLGTLFLAGDVPLILWRDMAVLCVFAVLLLGLVQRKMQKSLE